jgi:hypothetical protein
MAYWSTDSTEKEKRAARKNFPFACDVYSWALCCYYALTGSESREPDADKLPIAIRRRIIKGTRFTLADFLQKATSENAAKRPTSAKCEAVLKNYQKNCRGRLLSLSINNTLSDSPPLIFHKQPILKRARLT